MLHKIFIFIFVFTTQLLFSCESQQVVNTKYSVEVNVFSQENGRGLEKDGDILQEVLTSLGCKVNRFVGKESTKDIPYAHINIFSEKFNLKYLSKAQKNWFIPNPEYYLQDLSDLGYIDLVLCRTREVERIFKNLGKETYFMGFTTPDPYLNNVAKDFSRYLHVAGRSPHKGTGVIIQTWNRHDHFPLITVLRKKGVPNDLPGNIEWIKKYLPYDELRVLQNESGVHLCLSETEGFGHYLLEAMACGAVVLTTDAPPMNEFIDHPNCLVPYSSISYQNLGTKYQVEPEGLELKMMEILSLSEEELAAIGSANRKKYLKMDQAFKLKLEHLINGFRKLVSQAPNLETVHFDR